MNISYKWLKEYVPTDLGVREVAEALTRVGLNVDNITDLAGGDACLLPRLDKPAVPHPLLRAHVTRQTRAGGDGDYRPRGGRLQVLVGRGGKR